MQEEGYYAKYKTAFLRSNNYDVVFLGSSRVQMHYNTIVFDSLTRSNSFNLSMAGATPKIAYAALSIYLNKSVAPSYLIYDVDYHNLDHEGTEIKDFNNYFPFLSDAFVRKQFSKIDARMPYFYYLPYYSLPYTGMQNLSTSLHGWLNKPSRTDSLFHKGYFKESLRGSLVFMSCKPVQIILNKAELDYIDSIITLCQKKHIEIELISSPMFAGGRLDVKNKSEVIEQIKKMASIHHVHYSDHSSLPFCDRRDLFVDHFHMNYKGADIYTAYLAKFYSNNLQKKALIH